MKTQTRPSIKPRGPGRPREFDMDAALDAALIVFRERGYHAASLGELGSAMKLTAGSIYKAFADKRAIFLDAFARYIALRESRLATLLGDQRSGFGKLQALLDDYVEQSCGVEGRRGCLVVGSATELATFDAEMAGRVTAALDRNEARLLELIRLGQADGSISAGLDADATALTLLCLLQGLRVVGKTRRSRAEMKAAAGQALRLLT
ncbi:TetR/AcrR family transcriptional regulator [Tardiphaga sp.]|uniref:TetR/AcrR family transcriptional regulator n=1 Tax=Tardiphaga sp. TaxID=1926292 RepID=UPI00262296CE|nr:TetR/AcrR family transcriptional regulator [Tardiphaga sp.]